MAVLAHADRVMTPRNRRAVVAFGVTAVIHLALFTLFVLSTTQPFVGTPSWNPAFRVTIVPNPLARKRVVAKPAPARNARTVRAERAPTPVRAAAQPPPAPSVRPALAITAPAAPSAAPSESDSDVGARLRGALHGLAACHDFGVKPTEKERRACEDRLGRLVDAAPKVGAPPPPVEEEKPQKANTCRLSVRTLLSPRVKCKFW